MVKAKSRVVKEFKGSKGTRAVKEFEGGEVKSRVGVEFKGEI